MPTSTHLKIPPLKNSGALPIDLYLTFPNVEFNENFKKRVTLYLSVIVCYATFIVSVRPSTFRIQRNQEIMLKLETPKIFLISLPTVKTIFRIKLSLKFNIH